MVNILDRIPDSFEMCLFLKRTPEDEWFYLEAMDVPFIETESTKETERWICGLCGRTNALTDPVCGGCGAPPKHARVKGRVRMEGWLPWGGIFYSLLPDCTFSILYKRWQYHQRPDLFYEEEIVYLLENCVPGPVLVIDVAKGCREEGETPEIPKVQCDIACDCVFVGAPWREGDGQAPQATM
jgi:hypothetical protein